MQSETYIGGNRGTYTGETVDLHGGTFYLVLMHEGPAKGKTLVTQRTPTGVNPEAQRNAREWGEQQANFDRLAKLLKKP